jgi:hypothetical protein
MMWHELSDIVKVLNYNVWLNYSDGHTVTVVVVVSDFVQVDVMNFSFAHLLIHTMFCFIAQSMLHTNKSSGVSVM